MIKNEKQGVLDEKELMWVRKEFLMQAKKSIILFVTKTGVQFNWAFDDSVERDKVFEEIVKGMGK